MYITFRSQRRIGEAKKMGFDEYFSMKFAHLNARDGEQWSFNPF